MIVIDLPKGTKVEDYRVDLCLHHTVIGTDYKFFEDEVTLREFPTKKCPVFNPNNCDIEKEIKIIHEIVGYNNCVDELLK